MVRGTFHSSKLMKKPMILPQDGDTSVNLVNSLLKYYHATSFHSSLPDIDAFLTHRFKHIFLLVLDGLGSNVLTGNLLENSFLRRHFYRNYQAVYPCTTVAATDSLQSGKYPLETGWLGWHQYLSAIDEDVVLFLNRNAKNGELVADYDVAEKYLAYPHINELIQKVNPHMDTQIIFPAFRAGGASSFKEQCNRMIAISQQETESFSYVYWTEPDAIMHKKGVYSNEAKIVLQDIDATLSLLEKELGEESLLIITPDHGMIDVKELSYQQYPDFAACLMRPPVLEPRCNGFYVYPEKRERFVSLFEKYFGEHFLLLSKEELYASQLFGVGTAHPLTDGMIGDYVAIATDEYMIRHSEDENFHFAAHHAGLTKEEMTIPLILYAKGNK